MLTTRIILVCIMMCLFSWGVRPVKAQSPPCDITQPGIVDSFYICITDTIYVFTVRDTVYVEDEAALIKPGAAFVTSEYKASGGETELVGRTWCAMQQPVAGQGEVALEVGSYKVFGGITDSSDGETIWTYKFQLEQVGDNVQCFSMAPIFDKVRIEREG